MIRRLLRQIRLPVGRVSRFASRLSRAYRYGWDMVLWSHLLGRQRDPIPAEFPPQLLAAKQIGVQPPVLHISGPTDEATAWENGFAAVHAALVLNLQMPDVLSKVRYAHPAPAFQGVYLWDSAFIALIWKNWDTGVAGDILQAVVDLADEGRLQHVVADFVKSKYTQPPLIAWSAWQCLGDGLQQGRQRLQALYPRLRDYHLWLRSHRQLAGGLFAWQHPYESGIDNSPRFGTRDESQFVDTTQLASPDFSTYMVLQSESLAAIARHIDRHDDIADYETFAAELREQTNRQLWCEESGMYFDRHQQTGEFVRCRTIAGLLPLAAGIPQRHQADRLVSTVLDARQFNTQIPLPTVARNDPTFANDMWCGPVWINTATAVILGLLRYGRLDEAGDLAFRLCHGVFATFENCRRIFEFYDPDRFDITQLTRKQGNRWKQSTLGRAPVSEFVGWSGLVNWLVVEVLIGVTPRQNGFAIRPLLPLSTVGKAYSLRLAQHNLSISVERLPENRMQGVARWGDRVERFAMGHGDTFELSLDSAHQLQPSHQSPSACPEA